MKKRIVLTIIINLSLFLLQCSDPLSSTEDHLKKLWEIPIEGGPAYSGFLNTNDFLVFKTVRTTTGTLYKVSKDGENVQSYSTGGSSFGIPVTSGGVIYTNNHGSLIAVNEDDLSFIWGRHFDWMPIPCVDENYLYVTDENKIYSLNKTDGSTIWSTEITGKNAVTPLIKEDKIYFATGVIFKGDGFLYSINKFDGSIEYKVRIPYMEENGQFGGSRTGVEILDDLIYVAGDNRIFYCFEIENGEQVWSFETDAPMEVTPRVSGDKIYLGTLNRTCYALDAYTGEFKWSYQGGGSTKFNPSFYNNYVMFKTIGAILILDKNNGKELLRMTTSTTGYSFPNAYWDEDGKIFAGGTRESDNQSMLIAYQFK